VKSLDPPPLFSATVEKTNEREVPFDPGLTDAEVVLLSADIRLRW